MDFEKDFREVYDTHAPKVYSVCLGYASGDAQLAREWMQETFVRVWNHRKSFMGKSSLGTWIYRIAVNVCLGDLRKSRKRYPLKDHLPAVDPPHEEAPRQEDQIAKMYRCIDKLNEQNKVLILMELEEIPQATIAETTGLAHGSVRTRLSRIRKALLKCITDET